MAKIIAIANHKGGVGKTTSVVNIGATMAAEGRKVLLVDLDAQANLTYTFADEEPEVTVYDAIKTGTALPVMQIGEGLAMVPSSEELAAIELEIAGRIGREYILKDLLAPLADSYDYILLDCPPSLGLVTLNALVAATDIYIALTAEAYPTKGLRMLGDTISLIKQRANTGLNLSGIILTRWEGYKLNKEIEDLLKATYGPVVFNTKIRKNVSISEAPLYHKAVRDYDRRSHGAEDYEALTKEILERLER